MSEKPSPKSAATKPAAKTAGDAGSSGTKGASSTAKSKPGAGDNSFDFLAPPQASGDLGRLAQFRVLKVLGKGGMGIVFMAEDTRLHRIVALKVMLPAIAKKPIARDRFLREARATAAIEHDHIVTIYEVNEDNDVPYLVMQFLKGMTLEAWLNAGKALNIPQIMRIGKEIAKGLAAAHARQLIHRDIKPSNIWLDAANKGRVKILDFGLARPTNEETHITQEGMILGSPAYMSPEQARGQNVDERCDLFSLGCVLYRLCAGKLPFAGKDAMSMLVSITTDEPLALAKLNGDLPPALAKLVHQLLAKNPEDRPASAKQVVQTIQNIERDWIAGAKTTTERRAVAAPTGAPGQATQDATALDPALEESAITDLDLNAAEISGVKVESPRRGSWIFAGLGCSLLTVISTLCCLAVVMSTNHGYVQITATDETAKDLLEGGVVLMGHDKQSHNLKPGTHKLPAGGYTVEMEGLPRGLLFEPAFVNLGRGETKEIKVRYVPPRAAPPLALLTAADARKVQQEWAEYLKREVVTTAGPQGPKMVLIPPGEFLMGTTKARIDELAPRFDKKAPGIEFTSLKNESPQHRVRISQPFYFAQTEVTVGQFSRFTNSAPHKTDAETTGKGGTGIIDGKEVGRQPKFDWLKPGYTPPMDYPVTNITWNDAQAFCAWLSKKEGKVFRLPTEAEWEYACRAGTTTWWSFGDDLKEDQARDHMWYHSPGLKFKANPATPRPVGKKVANGFGLFDIHGNVAEMCSDAWVPSAYQSYKELAVDPAGPKVDTTGFRVIRGGSFLDFPYSMRSASRKGMDMSLAYATVGFRVVCEVPLPAD